MRERYYEGSWEGKPVRLDREYRGHYLTERECAALFRGRKIEIHGLSRRNTIYSIACVLEADPVLDGVVNVKCLGTVGMNPDYKLSEETSPFRPHGLKEDAVRTSGVDAADLDMATRMMIEEEQGNPMGPDRSHAVYVVRPDGYDPDAERRRKEAIDLAKATASSWRKALGFRET